jgi:prepilin-type N-terminal cleavage/methylation domain-containing protein
MRRGFTLIEFAITMVVLSILAGFSFSIIRQYADLYQEASNGSVYSQATVVAERFTRELRDAQSVDTTGSCASSSSCINFQLSHGTPADAALLSLTPPYWVQYCACPSGSTTSLYRVANTSQGSGNQCQSGCPSGSGVKLMSKSLMSSGFQVTYFQGGVTPAGDSYGITLKLSSQASASPNNQSITLMTRISPRNYASTTPGRSFSGAYYDEID